MSGQQKRVMDTWREWLSQGVGTGQGRDGNAQRHWGGRDSPGDTGTLMSARDRGRASEGPSLEPHPWEHPPPSKGQDGSEKTK